MGVCCFREVIWSERFASVFRTAVDSDIERRKDTSSMNLNYSHNRYILDIYIRIKITYSLHCLIVSQGWTTGQVGYICMSYSIVLILDVPCTHRLEAVSLMACTHGRHPSLLLEYSCGHTLLPM